MGIPLCNGDDDDEEPTCLGSAYDVADADADAIDDDDGVGDFDEHRRNLLWKIVKAFCIYVILMISDPISWKPQQQQQKQQHLPQQNTFVVSGFLG